MNWVRTNGRPSYGLICNTFLTRGSLPYLNQAFFEAVSTALPDNILVILAEGDQGIIAAALCYVAADRLYGRYWGADAYVDSLHFETCYYQGIEYCIENGLSVFEPGTQGEHKIARGFEPTETYSTHWLAHSEFADAIERYLDVEAQHIDQYIDAVNEHVPFRKDSGE